MIKDHRPYAVRKAYRGFENFYVRHFLRPQLKTLGEGFTFMKPWHVEIFGWPIEIGRCVHVIASPDLKVRFSVWSPVKGQGCIRIGDYCLICPGVRVSSAAEISIGDNTMLANGVYVTDSDWHDLYNRIIPSETSAPIRIETNVWIGDHAIICKGVTIGENSVIGAGAVVVNDVPANAIAAGNPARVVKHLDLSKKLVTRAEWFADPVRLSADIERLDRQRLHGNTLWRWIRHILFPATGE
ncbi:MAG: acyltransferase [Thermodesulfobacteriota bacterium]